MDKYEKMYHKDHWTKKQKNKTKPEPMSSIIKYIYISHVWILMRNAPLNYTKKYQVLITHKS